MSDVRRSPEEAGRQGIEEEVCDLGSNSSGKVLLGSHCSCGFVQGTRELTDETWFVLLAAIGGNGSEKGSPMSINGSSWLLERYRCWLVIDGEMFYILL